MVIMVIKQTKVCTTRDRDYILKWLYAWLLWLSVVMHGYQGLCMVISGYMHVYCGYQWLLWLSGVMHGYQWLYAWLLWLSVVMHGCGYQWLCMVISGYQWLVHDLVVFKVGGIKALSSVFN